MDTIVLFFVVFICVVVLLGPLQGVITLAIAFMGRVFGGDISEYRGGNHHQNRHNNKYNRNIKKNKNPRKKSMTLQEYALHVDTIAGFREMIAAARHHGAMSRVNNPDSTDATDPIEPLITMNDIENLCISWDVPKGVKCHDSPTCSKAQPTITPGTPYQDNMNGGPQPHIGQRKLFLTELFACSLVFEEFGDVPQTVIYAGGAPSNKIMLLARLFPNITFVLVDPAEFIIYTSYDNTLRVNHYDNPIDEIIYYRVNKRRSPNAVVNTPNGMMTKDAFGNDVPMSDLCTSIAARSHRIYLIEDYCTESLCRELSHIDGIVHFWSDIRTEYSGKPNDIDIIWNSAQHLVWINALKPLTYFLKFRLPCYDVPMREFIGAMNEPYIIPYINRARSLGFDMIKSYIENAPTTDDIIMGIKASGKGISKFATDTPCTYSTVINPWTAPEEDFATIASIPANEIQKIYAPLFTEVVLGRKFQYISGVSYLQPYAREQTGELRLYGKYDTEFTHADYEMNKYDALLCLFNNFIRTQIAFKLPLSVHPTLYDLGANIHADFAFELWIWRYFMNATKQPDFDYTRAIKQLCTITHRRLD